MFHEFKKDVDKVRKEVGKVIVGQKDIINGLLRAVLSNGHVLIEGVPGVAKTLLIRSLGEAAGVLTKRIQFTVDLLPTDITGVTIYNEKLKNYTVVKGPLFANFIIADEINRSPPKVQSALLEAMQERQVTIGRKTFELPKPFFVMANNNPIESSGVYPLPEAQLDRFLFKLSITYPSTNELEEIIEKNVNLKEFADYNIRPVISPERIIQMQEATKQVKYTNLIKKYIVDIVNATRDHKKYNIDFGRYIEWSASPRAAINLFIGAKADAILQGKDYISPQNIKNVAYDVMRHRIILNYKGEAEKIKTDDIIKEILHKVPIP